MPSLRQVFVPRDREFFDLFEEAAVNVVRCAELLEEMLEVQETLEEARAEGLRGAAAERLREERGRLEARYAAEADSIVGRALEWDRLVDEGGDRTPLLTWFKQRFATRAYLRTVIEDLTDALGEREEDHVSHRRH